MSLVTATVEIARPVEDVFAYVADRRNRRRLLPDNFTDVRVLTEESTGPGARFAFTVHTDRGSYESVTELVSSEPPHTVVERTTDGDLTYETHWRFAPATGGAAVTMGTRYPPPASWMNRLLDRFVGQRALRQSLLVELLRLKHLLEEGHRS